ncbi:MAG: peptide chain release factor N(5)-glutamine methyltransferase [Candidatus Peribacteraceae bacterium]
MTIRELCVSAGVDHLDAELILAHILKKPRTWLLAHDDEELDPSLEKRFGKFLARRKKGEPIAYITGEKEFFGRSFRVTTDVLIPRPATEGLVELALKYLSKPATVLTVLDSGIVGIAKVLHTGSWNTIVDIGTGSGCIAITLALEGRKERIIGVDTSPEALNIARENAERLGIRDRVTLACADGPGFVSGCMEPFVLIANPPYIPAETELHRSVRDFEPSAALFAGPDGLAVLRPLALAARNNPACKGIVLELREDQVDAIEDILRKL